ncbi:unnamed protein product [Prunus armeniaca]
MSSRAKRSKGNLNVIFLEQSNRVRYKLYFAIHYALIYSDVGIVGSIDKAQDCALSYTYAFLTHSYNYDVVGIQTEDLSSTSEDPFFTGLDPSLHWDSIFIL